MNGWKSYTYVDSAPKDLLHHNLSSPNTCAWLWFMGATKSDCNMLYSIYNDLILGLLCLLKWISVLAWFWFARENLVWVSVPSTSSCMPHSSSMVTQASIGNAISLPLMFRCSSRDLPNDGFSTHASANTKPQQLESTKT